LKDVFNTISDRIVHYYFLPSECAKDDRLILNIKKLH